MSAALWLALILSVLVYNAFAGKIFSYIFEKKIDLCLKQTEREN